MTLFDGRDLRRLTSVAYVHICVWYPPPKNAFGIPKASRNDASPTTGAPSLRPFQAEVETNHTLGVHTDARGHAHGHVALASHGGNRGGMLW